MSALSIAELDDARTAQACDALPLARLAQGDGAYLVAWLDDSPIGHVYLARTQRPELQDLFVLDGYRRTGVGTKLLLAAEDVCRRDGCAEVCLTVSVGAPDTRAFYERLGYLDVGIPPRRVLGTVQIRSGPLEVDDTLLTLVKRLASD
jgi:GNAT superfamily N-acetyltransferase